MSDPPIYFSPSDYPALLGEIKQRNLVFVPQLVAQIEGGAPQQPAPQKVHQTVALFPIELILSAPCGQHAELMSKLRVN